MFRLLRYFSITSFIIMSLGAMVAGVFFRQVELENIRQLGESQNMALTQSFSNSLWPSLTAYLKESRDFLVEDLRGHPLVPYLNNLLGHLMKDLDVVKIKIYNLNGICIYSTQNSQIGEDQSKNKGFLASIKGKMATDMVRRNLPSFDGQMEERDLIATYAPLRHGGVIQGVFELYFDVTPVLKRMEVTQRLMVGGVMVLFLTLYGVLFGIVRRADRIIKEQQTRLEHSVDEIENINRSLEERVQERTKTLMVTNQVLEAEIAERQQAEGQLRKLSRAVEQSPVSVIITDTTGHIEYVNPKFCAVSGYTEAEVLGNNPSILKSGEMTHVEYQTLWETLRAGREWRGEFHNRKKNGELFWEFASISPIRDKFGVVTHFVAVKEDITERKRAEESLRRSELRLRTIMDNVVEGIIAANAQGVIESVNPAVERIFGYGTGEVIGRHGHLLVPEAFSPEALKEMSQHFAEDGPGGLFLEREIQARRKDGTPFPLELTVSSVRSGRHVQFIATVRDISERKRAEHELEQARQKSFHQEKMAAIGSLSAGIVHEIGNPIAAISGLVEELYGGCPEGETRNRTYLEMIQEQIARLSTITRDVSEFSIHPSEEHQVLDINGLIERTMRLMRFDRRLRHVPCGLELDRNLMAVVGSDNQLRQVIINLLINAADAMEGVEGRTPALTVRTSQEEGFVRITVSDNGSGMDNETRKRAFDAFFTTKPVGKGTGLGLSLCYSIVNDHHGSIEIESEQNVGTRMHVLLPVTGEDMED